MLLPAVEPLTARPTAVGRKHHFADLPQSADSVEKLDVEMNFRGQQFSKLRFLGANYALFL
jgi:hypothetical protein